MVYAYKGLFNRNIDYDWSGGILLDFKKIVDKYIHHNGDQPAPAVQSIPGVTFDKRFPYNYYSSCTTLYGSLTSPIMIVAGITVIYHHPFQEQDTTFG